MKECCRWVNGLYSDDEATSGHTQSGSIYYSERDEKIIKAIAGTGKHEEKYYGFLWQKETADDEVAIGQIMRCDPRLKKAGEWDEI